MEEVKKKRGRPKLPKNRFTIGQRVWWEDPKGLTSGNYNIRFKIDDETCCIGNGDSEIHVFYTELSEAVIGIVDKEMLHEIVEKIEPVNQQMIEQLEQIPTIEEQLGIKKEEPDPAFNKKCDRCGVIVPSSEMSFHRFKGKTKKDPGTEMMVCEQCHKWIGEHYRKVGIPLVRKYKPVGRNQLCPCGSGHKYKYCCIHNKTHTELVPIHN
jgi:uncharacterized protein with PIN domain